MVAFRLIWNSFRAGFRLHPSLLDPHRVRMFSMPNQINQIYQIYQLFAAKTAMFIFYFV